MKRNYSIIKRLSALFAITVLSINITFAQCNINNIITTGECGVQCDGSIEIIASGGSGTYMYSIDGGATFQGCNIFTDLCAGVYGIVIDDMTGCQDVGNATINPLPFLFVSIIPSDALCNETCDGALDATPGGGLAPYTYLWNTTPVQINSFATGLCAGTYTVTVTDINGCQAQDSGTVSEPASSIIINSLISTDATSCSACDGTATVFVSGGMAPYSFMWSTGDFFSTITNLCAGTYTVTVTDGNACTAFSTVAVSEIGGEILTTSSTDVSCIGACDGTATVSFTCGDPSCSIIWRDGSGLSIGQTDTTATGLCAGDYFVKVTNNSGCISFAQVTINEPTQITATITGTNMNCPGMCLGTATATPSGGESPYTYLWSPSGQTNQTAWGLCAGIHTVIITDSLDCSSDTFMLTISAPDTVIFNTSKIDDSCGVCNGQAVICVTGGTPPNSYNWSTGSTTFYEDTLCAGTYDVTITDANLCTASDSVTIIELSNIIIDSIVTEDVTPCFGDTNGTITIYASSGAPPYEYSIDSGSTYQSDSNFTGLGAGTYNITVQSADLCPPQFGGPLTINEPSPIFIPVSDTICDNDSLLLEGEYQNTPGTYYDTLLSVDGCDSVIATTLTVNPTYDTTATAVICEGDSIQLPGGAFADTPGIYYDTLLTVDGCDSIIVTTLTVNPTPTVVIQGDTIACDSTILDEGVGIPGDTYLWSTGETTQIIVVDTTGIYWLMVTDGNGCQGSDSINVTVNPTYFIPLLDTICNGDSLLLGGIYQTTPGTYYDTLPTVNGCDSIIATTLTVNPLPVISITPSPGFVCNYGDTVMLLASGAVNYTWSPAAGLDTTTGDTVLAFPSTDTTYTVTGTNVYGCIDSTTVSVQLSTVNPVASFTASITNLCEGNTVTFNNTSTDATGFSWSFPGGTTADTTVQNPIVTYNSAGVFDVTLTALGCSVDSTITLSGYITVNSTYDTTATAVICEGDSIQLPGGAFADTPGIYYDTLLTVDGCDSIIVTTLTVNPTPTVVIQGDTIACDSTILDEGVGIPGDTYLWSTGETTQIIVVDTTGIYWLMVTDGNGCQGSDTINVTINPTYIIPLSETICDSDSLFLGGAYQTTAGTYYDTLPTVNGCDSILATTLTVNQTYNVSLPDNICDGDSSFIGGVWQTTPGIYYDTSATVNGCDSIVATTLTVNSVDTITTSMSICFGDSILLGGAYQTTADIYYDTDTSSNGCDSVVITTLTVNPLPPMPTVTVNDNQLASSPANAYQWYFYDTLIAGATSQFYTATQTGYYSVMVADVNGCWSVSDPYWVIVTSINDIEFLSNLNIYPNPNTGEFIIEMNFSKSQDVEIKLFYISGQMIYSENLKQFKGAYFKRINIKDFSIGVYLLKVKTDYGEINKKIVFE